MGCWLWLFTWVCWSDPTLASEKKPEPLEGALWHGVLTLRAQGPLFSQFLANRQNDRGVVIGFVKEKGEMRLEFELELQFLVNPLGEFTLLATEAFQARQQIQNEFRYRFHEEQIVKKARIKMNREVQVAETTLTDAKFKRQAHYASQDFQFGSLRFFPSGRMDKKGTLRVVGDLEIPFLGEGTKTFTKERQPPSEEYARVKKVSQVTRKFILPITFDFNIAHKKKAVEGNMAVSIPVENPFERTDPQTGSKAIFTNSLQVTGAYRLSPLFAK